MCRWVKTNHHAVHYAQRQQTLDSESERSCSHECSGEQAGETSVRHAGGTSGRTSDGPYRTKRLLTEHGPCVGAHRPLAGDAHGGHCHLDRGRGTWRTLPHLAATHIRQLVRRRALSGGGAQPSGQLVPAASQNDQAPPRYRAYLFGAVGGIAPDSGDLLARDSRPDQQPDQVHRRRSKRPRGAAGVHQGSLPAKRVGFFVPEGQRPARQYTEPGAGSGKECPLLYPRGDLWHRRVRRRAGNRPHPHVLPHLGQRAVSQRRGRTLRRNLPAARAAPPHAIGRGGHRLRHRQPRHQLDLRCIHLHRPFSPWHALCRRAGAFGCGAGPCTVGRRDAGRSALGHSGVVRRTVEGRGSAHIHPVLPAGGEQRPPTAGLQPRRASQRASYPHRCSGRWDVARYSRRVAGRPGGRDHPDSRNRFAGLPARAAGSKQACRRGSVTAHYLRTSPCSCVSKRVDPTHKSPRGNGQLGEDEPALRALRSETENIMESGGTKMIRKGTGTVYRIVMRSELSDRYAVAFEGMEMETKNGDTILRDCMKTPDRCRSGTPPSAENGLRGFYFGVWCYRRPTIGASPATFHTVSPSTQVDNPPSSSHRQFIALATMAARNELVDARIR